MQTLLITISDDRVLTLLKDLEALDLIKIINESATVVDEKNFQED